MNEALQARCKLMIDNKLAVENEYTWQGAVTNVLISNFFTSRGMSVNTEKLREAESIIKKNTSVISNFRGFIQGYLSAVLAESDNPEELFTEIKETYNEMKKAKFSKSPYLVAAATLICTIDTELEKTDIIANAKIIYKMMKDKHPILTADEDVTFATLLAMSGLEIAKLDEEMENCYKMLKSITWANNAVQSLSHVLSLGQADAASKCNRVRDMITLLKNRGMEYGKGCELAALGGLAILDEQIELLVEEMLEADAHLRDARGFGNFGIGETQRFMYDAMLVMVEHIPNIHDFAHASKKGMLSAVIAEQTAIMCAIVVASTAVNN